jgi:hypothetical protein
MRLRLLDFAKRRRSAGGQHPQRFEEMLAGRDRSVRHLDLSWSTGTYVCHVADNLRIYAERFAGAALGATGAIAAYDQHDLARVRNCEHISIEAAALWSIKRAAGDWQEAVRLVDPAATVDRVEEYLAEVRRFKGG